MLLERTNVSDTQAAKVCDIPRVHLEGLDEAKLEKMDPQAAAFEVGKNYFNTDIQTSAGDLEAYKELDKNGNAEKFAKAYSDYVNLPSIMKIRDPQMYEFMRDRVFYGKEFKYTTKSNEFGMEFPYSPAEGKELRKMALEKAGGAAGHSQDLLSNKMNFKPLDQDELGHRGKKGNPLDRVLY